ncbi:MAG: adenosylcobinamide-GDP ribazoletransferase [Peptococcaceae bacterium]|jgi:adenosylcobinamide-GDP ribazoletransferase|nr:adenosylcobinamide-GDP ribazoletransferase [Peptococcaceae bacterium]
MIHRLIRRFFIALTFLTRLPTPLPERVQEAEFTHSQQFYPLIGLLLGGLLFLAACAGSFFLPPIVLAGLLLAWEIFLSGGLHLDGFMDSMDGLLSSRERQCMLDIMKDSHVGAHACICLCALLLLKFSLLASLSSGAYGILILFPAIARWVVLLAITRYPYARVSGLGKNFHAASRRILLCIQGLLLLTGAFWISGWAGVSGFCAAVVFTLFFAAYANRQLNGLTGDIYGAIIEISEVACLLFALPWLS